jgi:hypothetical protein
MEPYPEPPQQAAIPVFKPDPLRARQIPFGLRNHTCCLAFLTSRIHPLGGRPPRLHPTSPAFGSGVAQVLAARRARLTRPLSVPSLSASPVFKPIFAQGHGYSTPIRAPEEAAIPVFKPDPARGRQIPFEHGNQLFWRFTRPIHPLGGRPGLTSHAGADVTRGRASGLGSVFFPDASSQPDRDH